MDSDGFYTTSPAGIAPDTGATRLDWPSVNLEHLANAVLTLKAAGWPSTFLMVYDEVWLMQSAVAALVLATTGNKPNMDMLIFNVDPNVDEAGFTPHRDRQPADVAASFRADGSPKYATCWVALRDATPDNSCLYMIPKFADPGNIKPLSHRYLFNARTKIGAARPSVKRVGAAYP